MKIAIQGAGIAGPTLAYWLKRYGHEPTIIERSPALRSGGYVIDFWGLGYDIAEKMGVLGEVRAQGYQVTEARFVDGKGRTRGGFKTDVFTRMTDGRFTSIRRSDLASIIHGAVADDVETIFGNSIARLEQRGDKVGVALETGSERSVDLLVGCDGQRSEVRRLAFGPDAEFERDLGYRVAACEVGGYRPREELVYLSHSAPGRQVSRFTMRDDRTLFLFVYRSEHGSAVLPGNNCEKHDELRRVFGGMAWETPAILEAASDADDIYFDSLSQIRMEKWTRGRVALCGDAGACVSLLAGEGTGLAMAEAYVLAGELNRAGGDHAAAFTAYEDRLMQFIRGKQKSAERFASSFAPKTNTGIAFRNLVTRLARIPFIADRMIGNDLRDDIVLPAYENE